MTKTHKLLARSRLSIGSIFQRLVVFHVGISVGLTTLPTAIAGPGDGWELHAPVSPRSSHAMAYDAGRGVTVLFGGTTGPGVFNGETWEWHGTNWTQRFPADSPSPRSGHVMAYDAARGVTVLFGGDTGALNSETWTWDGDNWTQLPAVGPAPRRYSAMAYDAGRGITVLFGGDNGGGVIDDMWEWNGATWTQRLFAAPWPSPRNSHAMVYDAGRSVVVLFGGDTGGGLNDETWEWNGTVWTPSGAFGPTPRSAHSMAYHAASGYTVLFGGGTDFGLNGETWVFDGNNWTQRIVASPSSRRYSAMAYDTRRGASVLFGGSTSAGVNGMTWEWGGVIWTLRVRTGPSARRYHALAYDAGRRMTVLFGGNSGAYNGETWEWDGTTWIRRFPGTSPSPRQGHALVYDSRRGVTVLFGGDTGAYNGETWEWNGTAWTQRAVAGPSPRWLHAMAYDFARGVTVLFGGSTAAGMSGETWEWNGAAWTQRIGAGPSPRIYPAMAYDTGRGVTVLFGGDTGTVNGETWEWNGTAWTQRAVAGPSARSSHAMAYDAVRAVTVLFGGTTGPGFLSSETWEWNGIAWTLLLPPIVDIRPSAREGQAMAYDVTRGVSVLFGGGGTAAALKDETWEWNGATVGPTCNLGGWCLKGDMDGNRLVQIADLPIFVNAIITDTPNLSLRCPADTNNDSRLNGLDVAGFNAVIRSPDADADGIPDIFETNNGVLLSAIATGTDPTKADTDGDQLKDGDEIYCTTAGLNLRSLGANPLRKNIFVECDWFDDTVFEPHSHRPPTVTVNMVRAVFINSPVANPYGAAPGITMFVDRGQGGVFTGGNLIPGDISNITWSDTNGAGQFNTYKAANFAANRKGYFQYSIYVHRYNNSDSTGNSELPEGDDFVVARRLTEFELASITVHELGHNFSLRHGGNEDRHYKPNYNSIMNYRFALLGIDGTCGAGAGGDAVGDKFIDYSRGIRISLNEDALTGGLNENHGVCGGTGPAINWDGGGLAVSVARNINCVAGTTDDCGGVVEANCADNVCNLYTDNNDWAQFRFPDMTLGDFAPRPPAGCQILVPEKDPSSQND